MSHTPACLVQKTREEAFRMTWPKVCVYCGGLGSIHVGNQLQTCEDCRGSDICPRCGDSALVLRVGDESSYAWCQACDWDQEEALSPTAEVVGATIPMWVCICEEEEADA